MYEPSFVLTGAKAQNYKFADTGSRYWYDDYKRITITPADFTASISRDSVQWGESFSLAGKCSAEITLLPCDAQEELPIEWVWTNNSALYDYPALEGWITSAPMFPAVVPGNYKYGAIINDPGDGDYNPNYITKYVRDDFVIEKARVYLVVGSSIYQGTSASPAISFNLFTADSDTHPSSWAYVGNVDPVDYVFTESSENRIDAGTYHIDLSIKGGVDDVVSTSSGDKPFSQLFVLIDDEGDVVGGTSVQRSFVHQKKNLSVMLAFDNFTYGDSPTLPSLGNGITIVGWAWRSGVQEDVSAIAGASVTFQYALEEDGVPEADWAWSASEFTDAGTYYARVILTCPDDCNYVGGTSAGAQFTIGQRIVTLNWSNDVLEYNGDNQLPTLTLGNVVPSDESNLGFTLSGEEVNFPGGTAEVTALTGSAAANYTLPLETTHSFSITQKIVYYDIQTKHSVYGDSLVALTAEINSGSALITGDETPAFSLAVYSVFDAMNPENNVPLTSLDNVQAYQIRGTDTDANDNYDVRFYAGYYYIDGATITNVFIAQSGTLTYNTNPQQATVSGPTATTVNNQPITGIKYGTAEGNYDEDGVPYFTNAGTYTVYFELAVTNHAKYDGSFTVTIGKADATWTAPTSCSPIYYNGSAQYLVNAPTDVVGGEVQYKLGDGEWTTSRPQATNAGEYSVYVKVVGDSNHNDNLSTLINLTLRKVTITITPNANQKKTYGDDDPTLYYIHSETINSEELIFTGALGRVAGENADTYAITLGTLALTDAAVNQNYELELAAAPVNFTIDKRTLAFDWETEFVFNGQDQKPVVENVEGLQNGHVWGTDVDIEWTDGNTIDAGSWTGAWGVNFILTGTQAGNYTCGSFKVDLTITRRPLTVTWYLDGNEVTTGASVVYSGTEHVLTAVAGNTCGGDVVTLQLSGRVNYTNALADMNASVTAKAYNANGSSYANYKIESGLANREFVWTISQKEVTLIWANYELVYNGQSQKPTATVNPTSLVPADSELQLTVTVIGGQIWSNEKAGFAYNAEASTLSGTGASNYKFAQSTLTHTFTIAQKEVGFEWENLELAYNKTAQKPTAYATGLEGSDICNVTVTGAQTNVGEYVATVTGLTGDDALNYKLPASGLTQDFEIVPKELEVDFNNTGFTYDGEEHAPAIILTGICGGDEVEAFFEDGFGEQTYAGDYTAIAGILEGADADNYKLPDDEADRSVEFTIAKRQIKLSSTLDAPLVVTYGANIPHMPIYYIDVDPSSTYQFLGDPEDVIVATVAQYNEFDVLVPIMDLSDVGDVGNYWLYVINLDEDNYDIVPLFDNVTDKLVISPKEVSFGWSDVLFDYDGQAHNPSIIVYGLETGDECEVTLTDAVVNAGNYTAIALALSNTNYKLPTNASDKECEFSIAPRIVELAWDHDSFLYDGQAHNVLASITNVVAGDEVSVEYYSGAMDKVNANDGGVYSTTATTLTGADKDNYTLTGAEASHNWTINPRSAAIKLFVDGEATDQQVVNVVYDGQEHTFEIKYQGVGDNNWLLLVDGGSFTSVGGDSVSYDEDYEINVNYFGNKDYDFEWGVAAKPITVTYTDEHKVVVFEDSDMWEELLDEMEANGYYLAADIVAGDNLFDIVNVGMEDENGDPVVPGPTLGYGRYNLALSVGGAKAANYDVTIELGDEAYLEVVKTFATLTAPTGKAGLIYSGQAQALVNAGTDVHGGELQYKVGNGEWSATVPSATNAGSYVVSWRVVPDENHSEVHGELEAVVIGKATHDMSGITFAPIDVVYDGLAHTATISGQLPAGVTVAYEVNSLTNVGETLAVAIFSYDEDNFNAIANMTAPVKVRKASLTATADAKSVTYGDAAPAYSVSYLGFVNNEDDTVLGGTLAFACNYAQGSAAGTYDIVPSGLTAANYDIAFVNGVLTVGKKAITVRAQAKSSVYGKALATLTATVEPGLVAGDAQSAVFTLATTATITSKPGQYPISVTLVGNNNYDVTVVAGVYTITEAPVEHRGEGEDVVNVYGKEVTEAEAKKGVSVKELFDNANADNAERKEVEVEAGAVTVVFDANAIAAIAGATGEVTLSVEVGEEEGVEMVLNITLNGATFADGTATVSVPFDEEVPSGKVVKVYYVDADGNKTDMNATLENGVIKFGTNHFSKYVVEFADAPKGLSGGAIAGIVIAVIVVLAGVAVAVILVLKKQGKLGGKKAEPKAEEPKEEAKEQEEPKEE